MFLTKFEVSGYRSLRSVVLDDLARINVFYGENGAGKSNILRALELFGRLLSTKRRMAGKNPAKEGHRTFLYDADTLESVGFGACDYSWNQKPYVSLCGVFREDRDPGTENIEVQVSIRPDKEKPIEIDWHREQAAVAVLKKKLGAEGIFRIPSHRRLETEELRNEVGNSLDALGSDLKRRLFWASVSPDPALKDRYWKRLVPLLRDAPVSLGEPVSVGTSTEAVDVRFKRADREISVGDLGSGIEQLLLILGLSTLCDAHILALEEPEMNLSWSMQQTLRELLSKMVQSGAGDPQQIFISSHSPLFAEDPFFDVTMVDRETRVQRRPRSELSYFGESPPDSPRGNAGQLLFGNFVRLPESVVSALALQPGQLVFFRQEKGKVTVVTEEDMDAYLAAGENDEG